jgi:uncharacterized Zn-binding protein involved in type VI secretion
MVETPGGGLYSAANSVGVIPAAAVAKQTMHGGMIVQGQPTVIIGG